MPRDLAEPIETAAAMTGGPSESFQIETWPQLDTFGSNIPDEIRKKISDTDVLVCDITRQNQNVYYEIGFAIGVGKPVAPVVNNSFANATAELRTDGLFDNIDYSIYENSRQLYEVFKALPTANLVDLYSKEANREQPLFLLDTYSKTDFRNAIVSAIKDSRVFFRSFDPLEEARLSSVRLIAEVSASTGVIIPILGEHIQDAHRHNLRGAFLAGLSHGLKRETLIIRPAENTDSGPTDLREFITPVKGSIDINDKVAELAKNALLLGQSIRPSKKKRTKSALQKFSLGASAAENEFRVLEDYFVETSEYLRTLKGEIELVTGRKGTGKTAIFFRVRDILRDQPNSIVLDLKPESHQLSRFREELLKIANIGVFDHTLAAFWYYVIVSEILIKLKGHLDYESRYDESAIKKSDDIGVLLEDLSIAGSGDFTYRLNRLGAVIVRELENLDKEGKTFEPERLTNIVFRDGISKLKSYLVRYLSRKNKIILLFDNIDKGWPASGVNEFDIRSVRLLIEALETIKRDFTAQGRQFSSVVFLRNDIYELLVEQTPDRGKSAQVSIDWTDRAKLRQLIFRRLQSNEQKPVLTFDKLWCTYFPASVGNQDAFDYFVDHCLMRPRFLINIIENAVAHAINRGHEHVEEDDCRDAVRQHANYLLSDFGYEIRDVSEISADVLYGFVGADGILNKCDIFQCFKEAEIDEGDMEKTLRLMLWYGLVGILNNRGVYKYIYDYQYDMKRLEADLRICKEEAVYVINPSVHVALEG
jgi:hypothetical protein